MKHSKQIREYQLHDHGIRLIDIYLGPHGVLTGSARLAQEARERDGALERQQISEQRRRAVKRKRSAIDRQIQEMQAAIDAEENEVTMLIEQEQGREGILGTDRAAMAAQRGISR
jgi:circadian clock protein KaiC